MKTVLIGVAMLWLGVGLRAQAQGPPPREPQGLRMQRTVDGNRESVLIPWGASPEDIAKLLPVSKDDRLSVALGRSSAVRCFATSCLFLDSALDGWRADTGDLFFVDRPTLTLGDGKFYRYSMLIPAKGFDPMLEILVKALGPPSKSEDLPRQNAYGAKWTGRIRTWSTPNCEVSLSSQLSRIDDGLLMVTYRPLAPAEKKPEGEAPF